MKDQLISFETAKLAKEKGLHLIGGWSKMYNQDGIFDSPYNERYIAPTQSLLQRWLREKHKCIVIVKFYNNDDEWEDTLYEVEVSEFVHFATHDSFVAGDFKTYEEALEEGLYEALKLI